MKYLRICFISFLFISISQLSSQILVKDIQSGSNGSAPKILGTFNDGRVLITASVGVKAQPWVSDGTEQGTKILQVSTGCYSYSVMGYSFKGEVYFIANDLIHGDEIWKTDGTEKGTMMLKNISPGSNYTIIGGEFSFFEFNNRLFFEANDSVHGLELWSTDGTENGTQMLVDISPGTGNSEPSKFVIFNDKLIFRASDSSHGYELWSTDGTPSGTQMIEDLYPGSASSVSNISYDCKVYNGWLYFSAMRSASEGIEMFRYDGSKIELLKDILLKDTFSSTNKSSTPRRFKIANDLLFFTATDGKNGEELWKTDGTVSGTQMVLDIRTGSQGSGAIPLGVLNGKLLFSAWDDAHGQELWLSDGTSSGTKIIKDIRKGKQSGYNSNDGETASNQTNPRIQSDYISDNVFYFAGDDSTHGREFWKTDGTESGTTMIKDINTGINSSFMQFIYIKNGNAWISATDGKTGVELYYLGALSDWNTTKKITREEIKIFPNPVAETLNFSTPATYRVFELNGREVLSSAEYTTFVNTSGLEAGTYLLALNRNGNICYHKFIRNK